MHIPVYSYHAQSTLWYYRFNDELNILVKTGVLIKIRKIHNNYKDIFIIKRKKTKRKGNKWIP